ncbi:hypothetical protein Pmar_PMAR005811 [Perkinsus marinus ATCC 50983]|uniref:DnaJ homolog subfamily C member 16 n=2 Tax=Perkinsus marinus (strain ATCC 50983 / TXsc) TaxID=423536 RepID=C5KYA0_PERM5|nr:hypothetical protein Pmar_PMAR005811 [Perkinsus marinus ATCC 50983]EER10477.1 hypothetical protein Pmar_PMAR005811 [Perkinsus marinus ATCC 50983]|eukprot:XP_002778682.1 hypothetical protein Pmar_PMAR005811 [Perkinsus marinus ATCC 50983]
MPKKSRGNRNGLKKGEDIKEVDVTELVAQLQSDGARREGEVHDAGVDIVQPPSDSVKSRKNRKEKRKTNALEGEEQKLTTDGGGDESVSESSFVMVDDAGGLQLVSDEDDEATVEGHAVEEEGRGVNDGVEESVEEGPKKMSKSKQRRLRQKEKERLHGASRRVKEKEDTKLGQEGSQEPSDDNEPLVSESEDEIAASGDTTERKQRRARREPQPFTWSDCKWMLYVLPIIVLLVMLKMGEEAYQEMGGWSLGDQEEDYYQVLNVDPKAKHGEIRNAYRKLAMKWHPDRNPNCESCLARFQSVAKAYETLGDQNKRKVYDTNRGGYDSIPSDYSARLTSENYHSIMDHSVDIWVVEVYSDLDEYCHSIAPAWDEVSSDLKGYIKFGRINSHTDRALFKSLPITPRTTPTIFLFMPAHPEIPPSLMPIAEINPRTLKRWILHELPIVYRTVTSVEAAEKEAMLSDHPIMVVYTRSSHTTPLLKAMIYKFSHAVNFLVVNSDQLLPRRNDIVAKLYCSKGYLRALYGKQAFTEQCIHCLGRAKAESVTASSA